MKRSVRAFLAATCAAVGLLPARPAAAVDPRTVRVAFQSMSTGISAPTAVATASDGSGRIYIAEQAGRIRVRVPRGLVNGPFLDIRDRVLDGGERGLLGIAFHPRYYENGRFFVTYTDGQGDLRVSRFNTSRDRSTPRRPAS